MGNPLFQLLSRRPSPILGMRRDEAWDEAYRMGSDGPGSRAPISSYPAPERAQSGMEPSAWDRPGMHAEEQTFRSFSASAPSHALPGAYPLPSTAMQVAQMQAAQVRL